MKKTFIIIILLITHAICVYSQIDTNFITVSPPDLKYSHNEVERHTPTGKDFTAHKLKSGSSYELTSTQKQAALNYCNTYYGNRLTCLGEATNKYNCHGYAWHMIENEIIEDEYDTVWMEYDVSFWYQNPPSYEEVSWQENAKIRFQDDSDHSAIATNNSNYIISKWGNLPLFKHHI